jgi:hypothetical protein
MPARALIRRLAAALLIALVLGVAGCSGLVEGKPTPTPQDFGGLVEALRTVGIIVTNPSSGDAGCSNPDLIPTAIAFTATGQGVTTPVQLRVYIFGSEAAYDRRRPDVDTCAAQWATDPATFETVDATPYVLAGQGPWPPAFKGAIRAGLLAAAGTSGTPGTAPSGT